MQKEMKKRMTRIEVIAHSKVAGRYGEGEALIYNRVPGFLLRFCHERCNCSLGFLLEGPARSLDP